MAGDAPPPGSPRRNGRFLSGVIAAVIVATFAVTMLGREIAQLRSDLGTHENLGHHAAMGEQMASVLQRLAGHDLKTADRFTRADWMAAKELILTLFEQVDERLRLIEERHIRDTEREKGE